MIFPDMDRAKIPWRRMSPSPWRMKSKESLNHFADTLSLPGDARPVSPLWLGDLQNTGEPLPLRHHGVRAASSRLVATAAGTEIES